MAPSLPGFKEHLSNSGTQCGSQGCPVQCQGGGLLMGPFQLRIFYHSLMPEGIKSRLEALQSSSKLSAEESAQTIDDSFSIPSSLENSREEHHPLTCLCSQPYWRGSPAGAMEGVGSYSEGEQCPRGAVPFLGKPHLCPFMGGTWSSLC